MVLFTVEPVQGIAEQQRNMKLTNFPFFRAKSECETSEPRLIFDHLTDRAISRRVLLIPLRSPGDQLQIAIFPMMGE